jgi:uracil-DNA glycosylase family 4
MFTGDDSGVFLYRALYQSGFANQAETSRIGDGLELKDILITAVCRCVPPDNKPTRDEMAACQPYLLDDLKSMANLQGCVALGRIALDGLLEAWRNLGFKPGEAEFGHNRLHHPGPDLPWLITSYHPSRQNTQTGRLTENMFLDVWQRARNLLVD